MKTPRETPARQIQSGRARIEDFLTNDEFFEVMEATRWRLIRVFVQARSAPKKGSTPGYIVGLNERLGSLAAYVQSKMGPYVSEKIFSAADVRGEYVRYPKADRELIARYVRTELIMRQLVLMRTMHSLWYVSGEWCLQQSVLDEYGRLFKGAKQSYENQRSFHGRPERDRGRMRGLRLAPGLSTAM